jgi:hypothetical protein
MPDAVRSRALWLTRHKAFRPPSRPLRAPLARATPQATLGPTAMAIGRTSRPRWRSSACLAREGRIHPALRLWLSRELSCSPTFFALGEDDLVVFNLVGHHLKFVTHPKEVYPRSRIGAVMSKAAASVGLLSAIGLVHHRLPLHRAVFCPRPYVFASLVLYGATYIRPAAIVVSYLHGGRRCQTTLTGFGIMHPL